MHTFGITDRVSFLRQDHPSHTPTREQARITGFYKLCPHPHAPASNPTRWLMPCDPDDPDFAVVETSSVAGGLHRPWHLSWEGPIGWDDAAVAQTREAFQIDLVCHGVVPDIMNGLNTRDHFDLAEDFPPLTQHGLLGVRAWVADCRAKAAAWVPVAA